jgi:hypothetical protein
MRAATVDAVNLVDGAEAALARSVRQAFTGIFGYPVDAISPSLSHRCNYDGEITPDV